MAEDPEVRPPARDLAEALQEDVPAARLPRGLTAPMPAPGAAPADPLAALRRVGAGGRRSGRPRLPVALAATAAVVVVGGAIVFASSASPPAPEPVVELSAVPPTEVQPGPTTTRAGLTSTSFTTTTVAPATTVPAARRDCPVATAVLQADVDGDGCPDALRYADGLLEAGDARWALGQPGDQVAAGNWGCQGTRTLALFRPSTGEVFRFEGWATSGKDLKATAVVRVPGGVALRAADVDRDGCHEAVVERATGTAEVVRLPRPSP